MNNNGPQPLFPRRPLGGLSGNSSESRAPSAAVMDQGGSMASSSNSRRVPDMEQPPPKRRRLTGKQSAALPPPRVVVTESNSVASLFQIRMSDFAPGARFFQPLALAITPLQEILDRRIAVGDSFRLKVELGWEARKSMEVGGQVFKYWMVFTAFKLPPSAGVDVVGFMASVRQRANDKMDFAQSQGSGLEFIRISEVLFTAIPHTRDLLIADFPELAGGSTVVLPKSLVSKHCVINIDNVDNLCFRYAIVASFVGHTMRHPERTRSYCINAPPGAGRPPRGWTPTFPDVGIDFSMLVYPVALDLLSEFEEANDLGVYVFAWRVISADKGFAYQIRRPKQVHSRDVQLLLFKGHFLYIKNFKSFFSLRPFGVNNNDAICHRCLYPVRDREGGGKMEAHLRRGRCIKDDSQCTLEPRLPKLTKNGKIPTLSFEKFGDTFDHPLVVFADFETYQSKTEGQFKGQHTEVMSRMTGVASYGYFIKSSIPSIPSSGVIKRGTADEFLLEMVKLGLRYRHFCRNPAPMVITPAQQFLHSVASRCYLCKTTREKLQQYRLKAEAVQAEANDREPRPVPDFEFQRDHDHVTGLFRGSICNSCNVKAAMPKEIEIFTHNLEGFDGHEITQGIVRIRAEPAEFSDDGDGDDDDVKDCEADDGDDEAAEKALEPCLNDNYETGIIMLDQKRLSKMKFTILANSTEKYMEIKFGPICFRDSFKFADSSLAKLIKSQCKTAPTLAECFPTLAEHHPFALRVPGVASLNLILQKVPMAYTSIIDEGYFSMPAVLPREAYYNDLGQEECSEKDYELVSTVVNHFGLQDQGDYHDLYLWTDVLALADCMLSMRAGWRKHCGLDLFKSVTLPSASYQAMLKMTKVRMELLCEGKGPGMELMSALNRNIRGGASCIFQPYAVANNPRVLPKVCPPSFPQEQHDFIRQGNPVDSSSLPQEYLDWCKAQGYDCDAELSWIIYIDANSLYPTCMAMPLPIGDYQTVELPEPPDDRIKQARDILNQYEDDDRTGYFIEVDFTIPEHLHDVFDYAPVSKRVVTRDQLSPLQHDIGELLGACKPAEKLVPFLGDQRKVLYHAGLLKFWVDKGVVITKVHNIWSFAQWPWMMEYIMGAVSTDPIEREILKKAMNSLYGKMLQDKTTQRNLSPFTNVRAFIRAASRENCLNFNVMQLDSAPGVGFFGLVETSKRNGPLLDMPRAAGMCILDNSKLLMLRVHYDWFKFLIELRAVALMSDTDSFGYKVYCRSIMLEMLRSTTVCFDLKEAISPRDLLMLAGGDVEQANAWSEKLKADKGKLGALKLENMTSEIVEFCGLAAKMYSFKMIGHVDHEGNDKDDGITIDYVKGKGVPKRALEANASHQTYKDMIFKPSVNRVTFRTLRSNKHVVEQLQINRKMLTAYNDKVYAVTPTYSRPIGHFRNHAPL